MAQISRLKDTEISNGNLINADDLDTEFNQLVSESNGQDTRLTNIEINNQTLGGLKTFSGGIATDTIAERTANAGVTVDGLLIKDRTIDLGSIGAVVSAVDTATERITTSTAHGLITPNAIRFETTNTLPAPLAINTTYFIGFVSATEINVYPTEADALASTNIINLTTTGTGTHTIISDPTSPLDGQIWFDPASNRFRGKRRGVAAESILPFTTTPQPFQATRPPVWVSVSTFTIAAIDCTDSTGASRMTKTGSTTVDVATIGLNGLARSTANLPGTMSYTNASNAVTGSGTSFLTTFVAGDTIWDQTNSVVVGVVGSITNDTSLTLAANFSGTSRTGVNYRRGARALNSWWYPYVISDGTTPGIILSNRNVAGGASLVDLPTSYTLSRQLPFGIRLNGTGSGEIINFVVGPGWPTRPTIVYHATATIANTGPAYVVGALNALSAGSATSYTAVSLASLVPAVARLVDLQWINNGGSFSKIRATGGTNERAYGTGAGALGFGVLTNMITNSSQSVDYLVNTASLYLDVLGYTVTEVA
jgi:hypothetical protein